MNDLQLSFFVTSFSMVLIDWRVASLETRVKMLETDDPEILEKLQERYESVDKARKISTVCCGAVMALALYLRYRR